MVGCWGRIASILFLCVWAVAVVLVVAYGPASALFGFCFGLFAVGVIYALARRFPVLLTVANGSSGQARFLSRSFRRTSQLSDNPQGVALKFVLVLVWALMAAFAAFALLFAVFTVALLLRAEYSANLTAVSFLCGFWTALTFILWKDIVKANSQ